MEIFMKATNKNDEGSEDSNSPHHKDRRNTVSTNNSLLLKRTLHWAESRPFL